MTGVINMRRNEQYIEPDNSFYEPSKDPSQGNLMLVVVITVLFVILTAVLAVVYINKKNDEKTKAAGLVENTVNTGLIVVSTPTPTPIQPIQAYQNSVLYPATASVAAVLDPLAISPDADPSVRGLTQSILSEDDYLDTFSRETPIHMTDPLNYGSVSGILTYRGNNFRNCASFGSVDVSEGTLTQTWEFSGIGSLLSSTQTFEWSGVAWTGQPLIVKWDSSVKSCMNLYPEKASKEDLKEVIVAGLDGYVYFFDLDDGTKTRDPIYVGCSIKGTPAVDPRGWPILYVGQGDDNASDASDNDGFGMRIYSLIDGSLMYFYDGMDQRAYRSNWGACDSSPIVDATSDTLVWPSENGIIYTFDLQTNFSAQAGTVSVNPIVTGYKYMSADEQGAYMGVESSIAVYGGYGYFVDNDQNLVCLDLNSMTMIWELRLGDDSDITPVIEEESGIPYVYVGTEVDNQGDTGEYCGAAYTYKINGLTGEVVWQTSQPCYTYNGESSDTDQTGGCLGNPIVGKKTISNLVIFSYSMTNGLTSGNRLVAYDKTLGTVVWSYDMNIYSYSSPVDCYDNQGNAYIVIADSVGQIHLINAQTGERVTYIQMSQLIGTESETSSGIIFDASPVVYDNMIVIGSKSGSVFGIEIG